jgi:hypothetical protein
MGLIRSGPIYELMTGSFLACKLSAEETCVLILLHQYQEVFKRWNLRRWIIAVPLQIGALPENSPDALRLHVGGLRKRVFKLFTRLVVPWPDLEELNALAGNAKPQIQLWPHVWRGPPLLDERTDNALEPLTLKFAQRHIRAT